MKRISIGLVITVLLMVVLSLSVSGQDDITGTDATEEGSTMLTVSETLPIVTSVEISVNGQAYKLNLPATLSIDAQVSLVDALLSANNQSRVGVLNWHIVDIREAEGEYIHDRFNAFEPSVPTNKLVVVQSEITNWDSEPFSTFGFDQTFGIDETGNRHEYERRLCDEVNPGATEVCTLIFDVPKTVTMVGLDLKVNDHKSIMFQPIEEE